MFVFLPFSDENPTVRKPVVTWALIGINLIVFIFQTLLSPQSNQLLIDSFGVRPSAFFELVNLHTIFTSAFLHGGFMHFAFNMLVLHIYGDNIENYLGRTKYIIFYFLGGIAAAFFQAIFSRGLDVPMIGASGCIAGIMGAYFVLYPKARINVFIWFIIFIQTIKVPASIVIGFWIITQLINATGSSSDGVAYFAHIGGFVFGYIAIKYFFRGTKARIYADFEEVKERDIPFFRKNRTSGLRKKDDD